MDVRALWLQFSCNVMEWHRMDVDTMTLAGVSVVGRCKRCGAPVMLDSQGNAFRSLTLPEKNEE